MANTTEQQQRRIRIPWLFGPAKDPPPPPQPPRGTGGGKPGGAAPERTRSSVTYMRSDLPEVSPEHAYGYGHYDGASGVSPQNYKLYVKWKLEEDRLQRLHDDAEERLRAARAAADTARDLPSSLAQIAEQRHQAERQLEGAEDALRQVGERIDGVEGEQKETKYRGSAFSAVLYLSVAVAFILADVVVAQRIVADSLKLTGNLLFGWLDESWLFAVGLAMVSVLLKPAYDRLVEERYWNGTGTQRFTWVMLTISAFALVTLFMLGAFRAEGFAVQARIAQVQNDPTLSADSARAVLSALNQEALGSKLGQWATVLSGLLFAISGAVSLSIGTRHAQDIYHVRYKLYAARRDLRERRSSLEAERARLRAEVSRASTQLHRMVMDFGATPPVDDLSEKVRIAREERDALWLELQEARRNKLCYVYSDGYSRGYIGEPEPEDAGQRRPLEAIRRALRLKVLREYIGAEDVPV